MEVEGKPTTKICFLFAKHSSLLRSKDNISQLSVKIIKKTTFILSGNLFIITSIQKLRRNLAIAAQIHVRGDL